VATISTSQQKAQTSTFLGGGQIEGLFRGVDVGFKVCTTVVLF